MIDSGAAGHVVAEGDERSPRHAVFAVHRKATERIALKPGARFFVMQVAHLDARGGSRRNRQPDAAQVRHDVAPPKAIGAEDGDILATRKGIGAGLRDTLQLGFHRGHHA